MVSVLAPTPRVKGSRPMLVMIVWPFGLPREPWREAERASGDHDRLVTAGAVGGVVVGITAEDGHPLVGAGHQRRAVARHRRPGAVAVDAGDHLVIGVARAIGGAGDTRGEQVEGDRAQAGEIARPGQGCAVLQRAALGEPVVGLAVVAIVGLAVITTGSAAQPQWAALLLASPLKTATQLVGAGHQRRAVARRGRPAPLPLMQVTTP